MLSKSVNIIVVLMILLVYSCKNKSKETIAENEFYTCSMDPQVLEKQQGICPICKMELAKVVIDKSLADVVKLSAEQIRLGGIKIDTVKTTSIWNEKTVTGVFSLNQITQEQVSSRFNGRIEKLYFKIPGEEIRKGDLIYEVYSRDLMQAEQEYLFALEKGNQITENNSLAESAKNKLLLWGLTEAQIKQLEEEKQAKVVNPIYSPMGGTAVEIPFKEGDYINEGSTIYKLADLNTLWAEVQVYSNELDFLNENIKLQVIPEPYPEEVLDGEIDFSNPELQPSTKINLLRIKIPNSRKKLLPGMMATVIIKTQPKKAIALPVEAVVQDGKIAHVWALDPKGFFVARQIQTGLQTNSLIEVVDGLKNGDVIAMSGAYLIYSDYVFKKGKYPFSGNSAANKNKEKMSGMNM